MPNYPSLHLIMHARDTILHIQQRILQQKISARLVKDFSRKCEVSEKTHNSYIVHA